MEKIIRIGNNSILLKTTAGVLIHYKQQFGRDYNEDYIELQELDREAAQEKFIDIGFQLLWSMAKTADPSVPPPESWHLDIETPDLIKLIFDAVGLFNEALTDVNTEDSGSGKSFSVEALIAEALICGLTVKDLDNMSLPMVLNTLEEWCIAKGYTEDVVNATQEDFDNF